MNPSAKPTDLEIVKLLDQQTLSFDGKPVTLEHLATTIKPHTLYIGQRLGHLHTMGVVEITRESPPKYKLTGNCNGCPEDLKNYIEKERHVG